MKIYFATFYALLVLPFSLLGKQPNVLILVSDDMGWNDLGYVDPAIQTPNLDRLASEGVRFERFYANPLCSVTRSALMTGLATLKTGVSNRRGLPLKYRIMAEDFKSAGYHTWMLGKWHLGGSRNNHFNSPDYLPHHRGFDHFYGHLNGALDYVTHTVGSSNGPKDWWRNDEAIDEEGFQTELLTNEAIKKIKDRETDEPFFLYLAYHTPHTPLSEPPSGMELYAGLKDEAKQLLYANISFMDSEIGRLLEVLGKRKELENTLIMFFNDNGGVPRSGSSNGFLRGDKGTVYEGGIRVRAFARWPEKLPRQSINYQFMWVGDLYPTLCKAAGIALPGWLKLDGVDLWRSIVDDREVSRPKFLMGNTDLAVFRPPWKLIIPPLAGKPQLFDVVEDPSEENDLMGKYPRVEKELFAFARAMMDVAEVSPGENAELSPRGPRGRGGDGGPGRRPGGGRPGEGVPPGTGPRGGDR